MPMAALRAVEIARSKVRRIHVTLEIAQIQVSVGRVPVSERDR
jgi:hypothetical protein